MSTSMSPYREPGAIAVVEKIPVKKTGLIPAPEPPPPHHCSYPQTYTEEIVTKRKFLFFFTKSKTKVITHKVLQGSLYRCPECLKVALYGAHTRWRDELGWLVSKEAAELWLEKTGEFAEYGES